MITALALAAFLPPAGWRFDAIPASPTGIPKIPISVPSDWKTKERSSARTGFRIDTHLRAMNERVQHAKD